jgi:hypothetical protein
MVGGSDDDEDDDDGSANADEDEDEDESDFVMLSSSAGHGKLGSGHAVSAGSHGCVRNTDIKSARLNSGALAAAAEEEDDCSPAVLAAACGMEPGSAPASPTEADTGSDETTAAKLAFKYANRRRARITASSNTSGCAALGGRHCGPMRGGESATKYVLRTVFSHFSGYIENIADILDPQKFLVCMWRKCAMMKILRFLLLLLLPSI